MNTTTVETDFYQECTPPSFADGPIMDDVPMTAEEKIDLIKKTVCEYRKIPFEILNMQSRKRERVMARQEIMTLLDEFTPKTLKEIGAIFQQGFDHSTVIHAKVTVSDLMDTDKIFRNEHNQIRSKIIALI